MFGAPRRSLVLACLIPAVATSGAHGQATAPDRRSEVRAALLSLRAAVSAADWKRIEPFLPSGTPWANSVRLTVAKIGDADSYTFWRQDSQLEDSVRITLLAADTARVEARFRVGTVTGYWSALFVRMGERWALQCTAERFGGSEANGWPRCGLLREHRS